MIGIRFIVLNFTPIFSPWGSLGWAVPACWLKRACPRGHTRTVEALSAKKGLAGAVVGHGGFYGIIKNAKERVSVSNFYYFSHDYFSALHSHTHVLCVHINTTFILKYF